MRRIRFFWGKERAVFLFCYKQCARFPMNTTGTLVSQLCSLGILHSATALMSRLNETTNGTALLCYAIIGHLHTSLCSLGILHSATALMSRLNETTNGTALLCYAIIGHLHTSLYSLGILHSATALMIRFKETANGTALLCYAIMRTLTQCNSTLSKSAICHAAITQGIPAKCFCFCG